MDEISSAAGLLMIKDAGIPVVIIRGYNYIPVKQGLKNIVRSEKMMSLSNIYNNFAKDKNIKSLFDSHSIPIRDYNLINKKYIEILEEYLNTQNLTRDKLMTLTEIPIEEVSL